MKTRMLELVIGLLCIFSVVHVARAAPVQVQNLPLSTPGESDYTICDQLGVTNKCFSGPPAMAAAGAFGWATATANATGGVTKFNIAYGDQASVSCAATVTLSGNELAASQNRVCSMASSTGYFQIYSQAGINTPAYQTTSGGSNAGGFHAMLVFGLDAPSHQTDWDGDQLEIGVGADPSSIFPLSPQASAFINWIGVGRDSTDTNLQFMSNQGSGTATKVDMGVLASTLATHILKLDILCQPPGGVSCTVTLFDTHTGTAYTHTFSSRLPASNVVMYLMEQGYSPTATDTQNAYFLRFGLTAGT